MLKVRSKWHNPVWTLLQSASLHINIKQPMPVCSHISSGSRRNDTANKIIEKRASRTCVIFCLLFAKFTPMPNHLDLDRTYVECHGRLAAGRIPKLTILYLRGSFWRVCAILEGCWGSCELTLGHAESHVGPNQSLKLVLGQFCLVRTLFLTPKTAQKPSKGNGFSPIRWRKHQTYQSWVR